MKNADLAISDSNGQVGASLGGKALMDSGAIEVTAGLVMTFEDVETGAMSATQTLTIHNTTGSNLAPLTTDLSDGGNYTLVDDQCGIGSALGIDGTCDITVRFDPASVGSHPATIAALQNSTQGVAGVASGLGSARVEVNKTGMGLVSSTPGGIACGAGCATQTFSFTQSPIVLAAMQSDAGWVFDHWTGACAAEPSATCVVNPTAPLNTVGAPIPRHRPWRSARRYHSEALA